MRNDFTDALGIAINTAFIKSGMVVKEFISYLTETRDSVFDTTDSTFHAIIKGDIYTFYFTTDQWFCKC